MCKKFSSLNYKKNSTSAFHKLNLKNLKIVFLVKDGIVYVGLFDCQSSIHYIKLYLHHMCVAFVNFNGTLIDTIKNILVNESNEIDFSKSEFFQLKIYELYFVKHITNHFYRIFQFLVNKEEMYLSYIKFKNMYVVDLTNGEILFDILAIRKSNKNKKYYKNEKLWQEVIHHSKILMENYKSDYGNVYDGKDSFYRFVKFECTSTYPRLTFIIKFLPILSGISIIHVYSQKKLSRVSDNNDQQLLKGYREIDLLYGAEVKNNSNIEFRYTEPRKLQEIEKFLTEFFISIRTNSNAYFDINHELRYFDYSIITIINDILVSHREASLKEQDLNTYKQSSIDTLISKINNKLYENFSNINNNGAEKPVVEEIKALELNSGVERDNNNSINFLSIKKHNILNELFSDADRSNLFKQDNSRLLNNNSSYSDKNEDPKVFTEYVEHDDGWAMKTRTNEFGLKAIKQGGRKDDSNKTLNLSKLEYEHNPVDASLSFSRKHSLISKCGEESDILFKKQISICQSGISNDTSFHTLDHLVCEIENKNLNCSQNLKVRDEVKKHPIRQDVGYLNFEDIENIPKQNVLENLIKQRTKSLRESNNISNNCSNHTKLNFNLINIPSQKNTFVRKETNIEPKVRLTIYDESPRGITKPSPKPQSGKQYIKIQNNLINLDRGDIAKPEIIKISNNLNLSENKKQSNFPLFSDSCYDKSNG